MNPLPPNVASLRPYQSARSLRKGNGWIFMDANESPLEVAAPIAPPLNRYPDPTADALRDAVAEYYGVRRGNLMMANGSDELIDLLVRCFVRSGRKTAASTPSYGMYRIAADSAGADFVAARLRADFSVDENSLRAVLDNADLLFICSPNNPTGTVVPRELIERLSAAFSGLIVVDEAYGEFADAEGVPSSIELVRRGAENVVVLRTFSKAFAAAGIRLGYCVANERIINILLRMKPPYNVNVLTQAAGLALWRRRDAMERNVRDLIAARKVLAGGCERLGCSVFPGRANFFLLRPPKGISAQTLHESLVENYRIVVRRFPNVPEMEDLLRVSVGTPEHNELFLSSLARLLP
ncbi:MAG: histidinol-phosphate transaminase [Planctomycetes bacterium]|nr:histidinol-phosphate transaminase [Planctomycetota bacterium]MBU4399852.1 histidinol-phosphate transaminase [Planctomycetota bacterium]MCG2683618.1 histidinol-phosphate transaminase [Planctomycetales bacterium]